MLPRKIKQRLTPASSVVLSYVKNELLVCFDVVVVVAAADVVILAVSIVVVFLV